MRGRRTINGRAINLSRIGYINRKINSPMNLTDLLTVIMDIAKELASAEGASLLLTDNETDDLIFNVVIGEKGDVIKGDRVPVGKGIAGIVAQTGEPLIVDDAQNDPRFYKKIDSKYNFHTRNILAVPMKLMDSLVGVLEVINSIDREGFDDWDLKLLSYLADTAAIAISNRRMYYDLTNRIDELTALYEFSQSLSFSTEEEDVLRKSLEALARAIRVERASIIIHDDQRDALVIRASFGLPDTIDQEHEIDIENSITGFVFRNGDPLLVADISKEVSFPFSTEDRNYSTRSFISIPIRHKNTIIGVLSLADKQNRSPFDAYDLRVLTTAASQIAEMHRNIQYQRSLAEQKRIAREIDVASEIQAKILPRVPSSIQGHSLAALNRPAKEVGGDFFDFFKFDENKYGVVVADVSGKGIPAALFMGTARNVIRAESRINNQPGTLLKNSNKYIYQDSEHGMFVTLVYLLVDIHNNIITFGSGGHNDQLLIRKNGEVIKLNAEGKALGIIENADYEEKVIMYGKGDMLVLFTDGILEQIGNLDIDRGEQELIAIAREHLDRGPAALIEHFRKRLESIDIDDEISDVIDDFTLFVIQF